MVTSENWHLNKSVPITLILAILFQTGSIIWFGAKLSQRVETLEENQMVCTARQDGFETREDSLSIIAERISTTLEFISGDIDELKESMAKHSEKTSH